MKTLIGLFAICMVISNASLAQTNTTTSAGAPGAAVETIICIRHAEKPRGGLGQLTCQGLNRALALPDVLLGRYGKPDFIFAPNPTQKVDDNRYYYIRPIATIEPTAIRCGMPLNTKYGYAQTRELEAEFEKPQYANATIFVAWEHGALAKFAKDFYKDNGGDPAEVPGWPGSDYDTIFIFKITNDAGKKTISFKIEHEGLNDMSHDCPGPARKKD